LLILGGALEPQKVTNKLASINSIIDQVTLFIFPIMNCYS
jgi:hypothetical protein